MGYNQHRKCHHTFCSADGGSKLDNGMKVGNEATHMSAVKDSEGFATVEDITVACL